MGLPGENIAGEGSSSVAWEGAENRQWDERGSQEPDPMEPCALWEVPWISFQESENAGSFEGKSHII